MSQEKCSPRERTYYDELPDYTRPALEIPHRLRERVLGRLESLYGPEGAEPWMPELERILKVHLLPFFPYSSDRSFAVMDCRRVDEWLGSWKDIQEKKRHYDLMFDAVVNHCSARSEMFLEFLNGNPAYRDFFIAHESPDELSEEHHRKIFRPGPRIF